MRYVIGLVVLISVAFTTLESDARIFHCRHCASRANGGAATGGGEPQGAFGASFIERQLLNLGKDVACSICRRVCGDSPAPPDGSALDQRLTKVEGRLDDLDKALADFKGRLEILEIKKGIDPDAKKLEEKKPGEKESEVKEDDKPPTSKDKLPSGAGAPQGAADPAATETQNPIVTSLVKTVDEAFLATLTDEMKSAVKAEVSKPETKKQFAELAAYLVAERLKAFKAPESK